MGYHHKDTKTTKWPRSEHKEFFVTFVPLWLVLLSPRPTVAVIPAKGPASAATAARGAGHIGAFGH